MSKLLVEDFESLDGLSYEKLRKLLDVAKDYRHEALKNFEDADQRVRDINFALLVEEEIIKSEDLVWVNNHE